MLRNYGTWISEIIDSRITRIGKRNWEYFFLKFLQNLSSLVVQWSRLCVPNAGKLGLIPGVRKIPGRRKRQSTPGFLEEFHEQRSLGATVHGGRKESDTTEHACIYINVTHCQAKMYTHMSWVGYRNKCTMSMCTFSGLKLSGNLLTCCAL